MSQRATRLPLVRQAYVTSRLAANLARPRMALFLFSHMRSYSSLLCHILNSNPEIDGYGELGISYRNVLDLVKMRYRVSLTVGGPLHGRLVLDKILHPGASMADEVLCSNSSRVMIGIREPEASVRSIIAMGRGKKVLDWKADPVRASTHYVNRLNFALEVVKTRPDALVLPTDALVTDTTAALRGLTDWLGLDDPLTPNYDTGSMTGRPRFGDTSQQIKTGTIQRERPEHQIEIPSDQRRRIWTAYERTLDRLYERARITLCPSSRVVRPD